MGSAVKTISPRRHSNLGVDTDPLYPYSSVKGSLAAEHPQIVEDTRPQVVIKLFGGNEGVAPRMWSAAIVAVGAQ